MPSTSLQASAQSSKSSRKASTSASGCSCHRSRSSRQDAPVISVPAGTLADRRHVRKCRNMRPDPAGGLSATGRPRTVATSDDVHYSPVTHGHITLADGSLWLLVSCDGVLVAVSQEGVITLVCDDIGYAKCIQAVDDGFIIMSEGCAPRRFTCHCDEVEGVQFAETELFPDLPPLRIARHDMGTATAVLPALTLRSAYSTTSQHLTDTDRAMVDKAMREAYLNLSDSALLRGRYIQPIVARYRLIGDGGRVLYTSAPVIVAPAAGLQGVKATLRLSGEGFTQCAASSLSAVEFVPAIEHTRPADAAWHALVRSVQLLVSPQLHPYSASLPGYCSKSAATTTQLTMEATLPGLDPLRQYAAEGTRIARLVADILDHQEEALLPMATPADTLTELQQLRTIRSLRSTLPDADTTLAVNLTAPHTFTAATCARSGDLIAWGNLTVRPFAGYPLPSMAISVPSSTTSLPTAAHVTMSDGSSVVSTSVMSGSGQPTLSPLMVYPSPDAVTMTLLAGNKALTLPLTPTDGARAAYYLDPDLRPMQLTEERGGFAVPSASPSLRHYPSAVALCRVPAPFEPLAVSHGDGATVISLLPAMRHSNSFTVPSARFYIFGHGGISSMTISDSRTRINMSLLDSRPVTSSRAVTPIAGGVAALAGGALVTVTGSRPVTLLEHCPATMLGWCDRYGELWCVNPAADDSEDEALIITPDGSSIHTRGGLGITDLLSTGAGMHLFTRSGEILDPSVETDARVTADYSVIIPHRLTPGTRATIAAGIFARELSGTISIGATHGAPGRVAATLRTITLGNGDLNHPLTEILHIPHSHALLLSFSLSTPYPSLFRLCQP